MHCFQQVLVVLAIFLAKAHNIFDCGISSCRLQCASGFPDVNYLNLFVDIVLTVCAINIALQFIEEVILFVIVLNFIITGVIVLRANAQPKSDQQGIEVKPVTIELSVSPGSSGSKKIYITNLLS